MILGGPSCSALSGPQEWYLESAAVYVEYDQARVHVSCFVACNGSTYIHFPAEASLENSEIENCFWITLEFNRSLSTLVYHFKEDMNVLTAREEAENFTRLINSAFDKEFREFSVAENDFVNITYTAEGVSDIFEYLNVLKSKCLKPDLGGFSENIISSIVGCSESSSFGIAAKRSYIGTWQYSFYATCEKPIQKDTDSHVIDVLNCFGVESVQPSSYAKFKGNYLSSITVSVVFGESVSLVSYSPDCEARKSFVDRGWYFSASSDHEISGTFYFGSDPTPVQDLTVTFQRSSGSNYDFIALLSVFIVVGLALAILWRQFKIFGK